MLQLNKISLQDIDRLMLLLGTFTWLHVGPYIVTRVSLKRCVYCQMSSTLKFTPQRNTYVTGSIRPSAS